MTSGQGGYHLGTHGARVPIQFLIGTSGWGIFIHAPLGSFDLTGEQGRLQAAGSAIPIDVFVIGATDPTEILGEYAKITGFPEMPPRVARVPTVPSNPWHAGGNSRRGQYISREETAMRCHDLSRHRVLSNGWNTDNGEFTWNACAFPDPPRAIEQLHDKHFKVALHIVLEGSHLTGLVRDKCTATPLPTGRTSDGHWPPDRQVSCYWPCSQAAHRSWS